MIPKSKKGFTLIECLISLVILTILLFGGISLYFNINRLNALLTHRKMAIEIANSIMETKKRGTYPPTALAQTPLTAFDDPKHILMDLNAHKTVNVTPLPTGVIPPEYQEVQVIVDWTEVEETTARSTEFTTYIAP